MAADSANVTAFTSKAFALLRENRTSDSLAVIQEALALWPDDPDLLGIGAMILLAGRRPLEALEQIERAVVLAPGSLSALERKAHILFALGRYDAALDAFDRLVQQSPAYPQAHLSRASALLELGRTGEALEAAQTAVSYDPAYAAAYEFIGYTKLAEGDYPGGFAALEHRRGGPHALPVEQRANLLQRGANVAGKRVLLHGEQGLGDTIQFMRYAPLVAERGAHVIAHVDPALEQLASLVDGVAEVSTFGREPPPHDLKASMLSLPSIFGTTLQTIPATGAYVRLPAEWTGETPSSLSSRSGLRVGLCWCGNPNHNNDANRSIALLCFERFFVRPELRFFSLQPNIPVSDRAFYDQCVGLDKRAERFSKFSETAALIHHLDIVVTVDTAVAHLAGAMGKEVWVLLPRQRTDWRWGSEGASTPWYPTALLYRQADGGWDELLSRVLTDLMHRSAQP